jgi:hypothetical protein
MPFSANVAVNRGAFLPLGSRVRLSASGLFDHSFMVSSPATFSSWVYTPALPPLFSIDAEVFVGDRPPVRLQAANQVDNTRISFLVLPGTPHEPRFLFSGNIDHPSTQAAAVCQVKCLASEQTAVGQGACVECENEAAIVKLCC